MTPTTRKILELLAQGKNRVEIAEETGIAVHSVSTILRWANQDRHYEEVGMSEEEFARLYHSSLDGVEVEGEVKRIVEISTESLVEGLRKCRVRETFPPPKKTAAARPNCIDCKNFGKYEWGCPSTHLQVLGYGGMNHAATCRYYRRKVWRNER